MTNLLKGQIQVSSQRGMPVNEINKTSSTTTITGETVQFYYYNSGVLTIDAGQAAGTLVVGKFALNNIQNALGTMTATNSDTSLSFTSTAATSEVLFPWDQAEATDATTGDSRLSFIMKSLTTNGQYTVDYVQGLIYIRKASNQTTLTNVSYKVQVLTSGSTAIASNVNIDKVGGVAVAGGALPVTDAAPTTVLDGTNTTTILVPEAIAASTACKYVIVQALTTNTGSVFVGNSSSQSIELKKGDAFSFAIDNLSKVYYRVTVDNEGIAYSGAN